MTDPNAPSPDENPQQPSDPNAGANQYAAPAAAPLPREQDVQWGSFAHLGGIIGFLPSLIIWLVFKDRGQFTNVEAKEALNFQITVLIAYVAFWILAAIPFIGIIFGLLAWAPWIVSLIFSILAFMQAKDGNHYRYPFAIRFIK